MEQEITLAATLSSQTGWYGERLREIAALSESLTTLHRDIEACDAPSIVMTELQQAWQPDRISDMKKRLMHHGIAGVVQGDNNYPELLAAIPDAPYVLYTRGSTAVLNQPYGVSCVGTRRMSTYGKRVVGMLINGLVSSDCHTVSGLALGVDAEVHRASVENGIPTVAVLGGGLDRFEPVTNAVLGRKIIESGGCLVSEYPPGVRPQKHHFLARNRIIAGLTSLTIVVEGQHHSGSLVTARLALQYGREVGAVPGDVFQCTSEGPLALLRDGAWPIARTNDILDILGLDNCISKRNSDSPLVLQLQTGMHTLDMLIEQTGMSLVDVQEQLTLLELDGLVAMTEQGEYYLK